MNKVRVGTRGADSGSATTLHGVELRPGRGAMGCLRAAWLQQAMETRSLAPTDIHHEATPLAIILGKELYHY